MPISAFEDSGPPIEEREIAELEHTLGVTLPPDYRTFLLRTNGGRPVPEDAFGDDDTGSIMAMFHAVKHDDITAVDLDAHAVAPCARYSTMD